MSVLIKGMEMPETCEDCIFFTSKPVSRCTLLGNIISSFDDDRLSDCPMVEIETPHGRLIDADTIMEQWGLDKATKYRNETAEQQHFSYSTMMMYEIADILDDAPVVIEAEGEG